MNINELENILYNLFENDLISKTAFDTSIKDLRLIPSSPNFPINPFLEMFELIKLDRNINEIKELLNKLESQIEETANAWDTGDLSKETTKELIQKYVNEKNQLLKIENLVQNRLKHKYTSLKILDHSYFLDMDEFLTIILNESTHARVTEFVIEFQEVWRRCSENIILTKDIMKPEEIDEVEIEILNSLISPIKESYHLKLDLHELIPPIKPIKEKDPLFSSKTKEISTDIVDEPRKTIDSKLEYEPWDYTGEVIYIEKEPVGLVRPPIVVNNAIYLPIVKEKPLDATKLKEKYETLLKNAGIDITTSTIHQISELIAQKVEVPVSFGLQPSIFNKWINLLNIQVPPEKPELIKVMFISYGTIKGMNTKNVAVKSEDLIQLEVSAWIPAPGKINVSKIDIGSLVTGMAGSIFGIIKGVISSSPYGQALIIQREIPPSKLLEIFLIGLGKRNLSEYRIYVTKEFNIGESEVFSPETLWKINNKERFLISPHEIVSSYYTVLPSAAFKFKRKIEAKIGVYFHSIAETFRYLIGKPIFIDDKYKGIIYGFFVNNAEFFILWTAKDSVELIKEIGRKSSDQYVERFQRRVSMALAIPPEESLWPNNLARYFLNFIWMEEDLSLKNAIDLIESRFSLNRVSFSSITEISKNGAKCKTFLG
ncbi:hypothetical protein [Candidatus Hodarchaeum mangrovi]